MDLITVAQALHWFGLPAFYGEAGRVLRPGGILAVWCYGQMELPSAALQHLMDRFYSEAVGPYWPPERHLVEEGYRSLRFPFVALPAPAFAMETQMSRDALLGYLGTWSATQRCQQATGRGGCATLGRAAGTEVRALASVAAGWARGGLTRAWRRPLAGHSHRQVCHQERLLVQ